MYSILCGSKSIKRRIWWKMRYLEYWVTYLILCGKPPFIDNSNNEIFKKIVNDNAKFNFYKWKNISNNEKYFVRIFLNKIGNKNICNWGFEISLV